MTTVVLDASAALAWLLPSQATVSADALLKQADDYIFIAPDIFAWEVTNILMIKAKGRSLAVDDALNQLAGIEIVFDEPLTADEIRQLVDVAAISGVSLFDVAYLALAMERGAALASRDGQLLTAAANAGLSVFDLRG
ncbi:MAG: type II toxin-antitoxin system VapC family toxin [Brevundimonas sp.]|jgi:predicted nucleic acid-binding protein|uniref:type II toxin-antitoxin system VapC family toxin n=1 Tax=Brevundimonas sp. TaxID=1871086 RepID=UPI0040349008